MTPPMSPPMMGALQRLGDRGVLEPLDVHFARSMGALVPDLDPAVLLGAAFASRAVGHGHVCADLRRILERPLVDAEGEVIDDVQLPSIFEWVMQLGQSALCSDGSRATPLVFDGEARLYLARYWRYQRDLASDLLQRATAPITSLTASAVHASIERLFADTDGRRSDARQKMAAAVASLRKLTVITGGPGTGKTSTVARILALLVEQAMFEDRPRPRIRMLAPTGKAAARLVESIAASLSDLDCAPEVKTAITAEASTIHRALGFQPFRPTAFAHDRERPLPADIVLVDEASMVDLALMAKLVQAVPAHARLLLLGDKDQLASVEAGAILGDICNTTGSSGASASFLDVVSSILGSDVPPDLQVRSDDAGGGVWDCIVELTHSFRFDDRGGIGRLARAINAGNADDAVAQLRGGDEQVRLTPLTQVDELGSLLRATVLPELEPYLQATTPTARLEQLARYRLLSAHRRGSFGTDRLNAIIEELLGARGLIDPSAPDYAGRPILVTQNDYQLELYNGDVGVLHADETGSVRAWFPGQNGALRSFVPARLPPHESVWAMTVHKSQGSEFERIGLLIPPQVSPLLTRELLYTGVTRARRHVTLYGAPAVLHEAIGRRIDRASGLRDALWNPPG